MSEHMPHDPDFSSKESGQANAVQVTLSKEQIVMIGAGMGALAGIVLVMLLK